MKRKSTFGPLVHVRDDFSRHLASPSSNLCHHVLIAHLNWKTWHVQFLVITWWRRLFAHLRIHPKKQGCKNLKIWFHILPVSKCHACLIFGFRPREIHEILKCSMDFLGWTWKTSPKESVRAGTSILNTFAGMVSPVMSLEIDHYINVLRCDAMCRLLVPFATTYSPKRVLNVVFLDGEKRGLIPLNQGTGPIPNHPLIDKLWSIQWCIHVFSAHCSSFIIHPMKQKEPSFWGNSNGLSIHHHYKVHRRS